MRLPFTRTGIIILGGIVIAGGMLLRNTLPEDMDAVKAPLTYLPKLIQDSAPIPSPFPFQELTIPYLRSRTYRSTLSELKETYDRANATGYLTSFNSDGFTVNSLLVIPKGEPPEGGFPAIVFVHGYIPPQQYNTLENYTSYANTLADEGIIVLKIDLRGHGNSEGEASGAYYSGDYVIDVLNAYAALQQLDSVNPDRIGLWGHSMAGNVVFRALAAKPSIPKVVVWAGAVYTYEDMQQYRINDASYRPPPSESQRQRKRQELFDAHGPFDPDSWFWKQVPATNYLDGIAGEVQVHHAVNDSVVNIGYSRNLMEILDSTAIPHRLYEYSSGGHNITGQAHTQALQRTAEFLKKE